MASDRNTGVKSRYFVFGLLLSLAACISSAVFAAGDAGLEQLGISEGNWVYRGQVFGDAGSRPTDFVWHADCRWSANRAFMMCSFSNTWGKQHINSRVVDTFNRHDKAFWHYEIFEDGDAPEKPFALKMQIDGPTRIEEWTERRHGKAIRQRIVYNFTSDKTVTVSFQQSDYGKAWKTTARGRAKRSVPESMPRSRSGGRSARLLPPASVGALQSESVASVIRHARQSQNPRSRAHRGCGARFLGRAQRADG
jgi:hypothetical protein